MSKLDSIKLSNAIKELLNEYQPDNVAYVVDQARANNLEVYENSLSINVGGMPDLDLDKLHITPEEVDVAVRDFAEFALTASDPDFVIQGRMGKHWGLDHLDQNLEWNFTTVVPHLISYIESDIDADTLEDYDHDEDAIVSRYYDEALVEEAYKAEDPVHIQPAFLARAINLRDTIKEEEERMQQPSYWNVGAEATEQINSDLANMLEDSAESVESVVKEFRQMVQQVADDFKATGFPKSDKYLLSYVNKAVAIFSRKHPEYLIVVGTDNDTAVISLARGLDTDIFYQARINASTKKVRFTDIDNSNY